MDNNSVLILVGVLAVIVIGLYVYKTKGTKLLGPPRPGGGGSEDPNEDRPGYDKR